MFCQKCGNEVSDGVKFCPKCGGELTGSSAVQTDTSADNKVQKIVYMKHKGFWSTGRLVVGIFSILLFVFITFQSCVAGLGNALMENGATSGTQGMITALCYLIAGIVGIATRNSLSKIGPIITAVIYWIGALFTIGAGETYGDLPIWGTFCVIFGLVFMVAAIKTTGEINNEK